MPEQEEQTEETRKGFYDKYYKLFLIAPAILIILSLSYLAFFYYQNGDIIRKDITLTGGTSITVNSEIDILELENTLSSKLEDISVRTISDIRTRRQIAFVLETKSSPEQAKQALEQYLGFELNEENSSIEFTGSSIGQGFYQQLIFAILIAFSFMGLVVFIIFGQNKKLKVLVFILTIIPLILFAFKLPLNIIFLLIPLFLLPSLYIYIRYSIPSFAVILSAFADIVMTLALVNILGFKISTAGIVAFLMLIGYSVDTDIMLTSRLLKIRDKALNSRLFEAFKTGMTMTLTSIAAILIALLITMSFSAVLKQIFTVLLIGLAFDIFNTWISNASILKWYLEK